MIDVEIEDQAWVAALPDAEAVIVKAAKAALSSPPLQSGGVGSPHGETEGARSSVTAADAPSTASRSTSPVNAGGEMQLTILLTGDATVQDLNARFRGKDASTNILSFPAPAIAAPHLGDIALAYGVCAREAAQQDKSLAHHLMHLTAHGVLHLLGYDHETDADAEVMEALERDILASLGVADPYAPPISHETDVPL